MNWYKQAKQEWARWQIVEMLEKAFRRFEEYQETNA